MLRMLIIVHVVGPVVETVQRMRQHPEETEFQFLDRAIVKAKEIVKKGTPQGFDTDTDFCGIFAVDEQTGEGTEVWNLDEQNESA